MSGGQQNQALNGTTALGLHDQEMDRTPFGFRVFNIVMISLASCVLTITALYYITVCYNRTRQSKRAYVYESAVTGGEPEDPVAVKGVKRSTSFINPLAFFKKPEGAKNDSRIYYIYSNPLPVGLKEDEEEQRSRKARQSERERTRLSVPLSFQEFAKDPDSGVILDPPIFYMQL